MQVGCHYVSINSSDKNKCYELIKKLSAIYHSDKEYLKVCILKCVQFKMHCFVLFPPLQFICVCLHTVGKTLAAASSSERGRGCGQERITAVMATDGPAPLRLPQWGRAAKWNSTACKLSPDVNSVCPKWKKHSWIAVWCFLILSGCTVNHSIWKSLKSHEWCTRGGTQEGFSWLHQMPFQSKS